MGRASREARAGLVEWRVKRPAVATVVTSLEIPLEMMATKEGEEMGEAMGVEEMGVAATWLALWETPRADSSRR